MDLEELRLRALEIKGNVFDGEFSLCPEQLKNQIESGRVILQSLAGTNDPMHAK